MMVTLSLQFMVMSFTNKQLAVYEDEDSLQTKDPLMLYQFSQIYTVRTLNPGEHEILRVKQSDLKKILMVSGCGLLLSKSLLSCLVVVH
jgi:hypothetical protein